MITQEQMRQLRELYAYADPVDLLQALATLWQDDASEVMLERGWPERSVHEKEADKAVAALINSVAEVAGILYNHL